VIQHRFWRSKARRLPDKLIKKVSPVIPGLAAFAIATTLQTLGIVKPAENLSYQLLFHLRQRITPAAWDDRVAVIAIDEASLKRYGAFPWARSRYTELLKILAVDQPAVVGFDILFSEPSPLDASFAAALEESGNGVIAVGVDAQGQAIQPIPLLARASRQGQVLNAPDTDGISRQTMLYVGKFPALSVAMIQVYNESLQNTIAAPNRSLSTAAIALPAPSATQPTTTALINWINTTQSLPTYSYKDVMAGNLPSGALTNKLVLVGITATGFDPLITPLNEVPPTAGVYAHAAVMDNLLRDRFLHSSRQLVNLAILLVLALLTNVLLLKPGPLTRSAIFLGLAIAWMSIAIALFSWGHLWLPLITPIGTILMTGIGLQLREQSEKQLLMDLFARQVTPEVAETIWQNRAVIFKSGEIPAQEMVATVMFMDIQGFTSISEGLPPAELLRWLNRTLDAMTRCILERGGIVDKYIGDAIMAVFGVPIPHYTQAQIQQDAINALEAAIAMHQEVRSLNDQFQIENKPSINIRIGIHTGLVVAGSVGGFQRMNYSVVGDTVNVAARLEAYNKEVTNNSPYNVLLSANTLEYVGQRYPVEQVGEILLRGRQHPVQVYCLSG
jgi:adenylate cyclase